MTVIATSVGLAMDAFSVSVGAGMVIDNPTLRHYFRLSFHFGLFQFMMPILGYLAGVSIEWLIRDYDHWVAMALLSYIGLKMIKESFSAESKEFDRDPSRGWNLFVLSVATSIDALAVGLSIGVLGGPIMLPSVIIGIVCALFSIAGVGIGKKAGSLLGKRVERIGGLILIAIGAKIALEHFVE